MLITRRARIEDIATIMQFTEDHWLHGYLLANNREFFNWQFVHDDKVNIWIGIDDETGVMYGMQAVIFFTYDSFPDIAGCMWQVIKSSNPMLSLDLQDLMWADIQPRICYSPGLRPDAIRIMEKLSYPLSKMDHYYRLADIDNYLIAIIKNKEIEQVPDSGYRLTPIYTIEDIKSIISEDYWVSHAPRKNYEYLKWRYFDHPIFNYEIWGICAGQCHPQSILITREEHANGASSCKIVDFYGDVNDLVRITQALDELITNRKYEFIDIYSYGVPVEIYEKAGFSKCDVSSDNIITNFFQPYTPVNSDIFLVTPYIPETILFRGDSDQDKPRFPSST